MKVEQLERDTFFVESEGRSKENLEGYRVDLSKEDFGCSCKDWQFRHRRAYEAGRKDSICKHIKAARKHLAGLSDLDRVTDDKGLVWLVIKDSESYRIGQGHPISEDQVKININNVNYLVDIGENAWIMGSEQQARDTINQFN